MNAKIICFASAKGGSGKTLLVATFGAFLSAIGKNVLLIDADAATNGLSLMYLKDVLLQEEMAISATRKPKGIFELGKDNDIEIVKLKHGVDLLPASFHFMNTEATSPSTFAVSLTNIIPILKDKYDIIFIDAQSGSDAYAGYCISKKISDEVVIVSEFDPISAAGLERLKGLFREDLTYVRTWVLLNKLLPDFIQSFSSFLEVAKYLTPIPWDSDVVRAYAKKKLALDLDNINEFTLSIMQSLKTLLSDLISNELEEWTSKKAELIRKPYKDQMVLLELELKELFAEKTTFANSTFRSLRIQSIISATTMIIAGISSYILSGIIFQNPTLLDKTFTVVAGSTIVFSVMMAMKKYIYSANKGNNYEYEKSRFRRRQVLIEEKLRKLEDLNSADIETLIKLRRQLDIKY